MQIKEKIKYIIVLLLLLLPILCFGGNKDINSDNGNEPFYIIKKELEKKETEKVPVFFSKCEEKVGNRKLKYILFFEVGKREAILLETEDNIIVNVAILTMNKEGFQVEETGGGVYSYGRVLNIANELVEYGFRFIRFNLETLLKENSVNTCKQGRIKRRESDKNGEK